MVDMILKLGRWLADIPPSDSFQRRTAATVQGFCLGLTVLLVANGLAQYASSGWPTGSNGWFGVLADLLTAISSLTAVMLIRNGRIRAGYTLVISAYVGVLCASVFFRGLAYHSTLLVRVFAILLVLAALLLGRRALWATLGTLLISMALGRGRDLGQWGGQGPLQPPVPPFGLWGQAIAVMILLCVILDRFGATLTEAYAAAVQRRLEAERANEELRAAKDSLEREMERRRETEALLYQAQKQEAVGRLSGGIAHDFNNLLTVILGFAHLSREALPREHPEQRSLDGIVGAAERGAALTRQLLAFARKQIIAPEALFIETRIRELEPILRRLLGELIRVEMDFTESRQPVRMDPGQLDQVLMNLSANARDAMPEGGVLRFETTIVDVEHSHGLHADRVAPGAHVRLRVRDTGHGMDRDTLANVFEPFFTTKEPGKGTGLGLATCQGIVRQAEGSITAHSETERGTMFEILLPTTRDLTVPRPLPAMPIDAFGLETVLVLEDDPLVMQLVVTVLVARGYQVHGESDAAAAQRWSEQHDGPIDLLLTDVMLHGEDGLGFAEALARRRPGLAVIIMSGHSDEIVARRGIPAPGIGFLPKPFSPAMLLERVQAELIRRRMKV